MANRKNHQNESRNSRTGVGLKSAQLGKVSQGCKAMGYSRGGFYRYKTLKRSKPQRAGGALNDKDVPFFDSQGTPLPRISTGRGSWHCGNRERHEYIL
jgi:hypothetical protein